MKFVIGLLALLASTTAFAQSQQRSFTITLPESQLNYVGKVLGKQPFEEAAPTMTTIQQQVNQQMQAEARSQADERQKAIDKEVEEKLKAKAEDKQ